MSTSDRDGSPVVVWERDDPGDRAPVPLPGREAVVHAAMALADADGLAAVSVRKVAGTLGIGPMRLYRVFDTVDDLTELMLDAVYGRIVAGLRLRGSWRQRTRTILTSTRREILDHEWVADLLGTKQHLGPNSLAWLEMLAAALRGAPVVTTPGRTWAALGAVNGFFIGAVRREVADRRAGRSGGGTPDWQTRMAPYLRRMLESGRYPTLRDLLAARGARDPDVAFRAEMDVLLAGLDDAERSARSAR